jgi:NAD-dependent SIR2 family protein deacetylase
MSDLYIHEKLRKIIKERKNQIQEHLLTGPIDDLTVLKELRARLAELAIIEQEIDSLQQKVEYD